MDLNLNNYDLTDLLKLFHLKTDFSTQDLKNAKSFVYKVHPDKSGLDKKFFLFFSNAYKILYKLHNFKSGNSNKYSMDQSYDNIVMDDSSESNKKILEQHKEFTNIKTNHNEFNKWFNKQYEEHVIKDREDDGYGKWLKQENNEIQTAQNPTQMAKLIEERKQLERNKQLTVYKTFEPLNTSFGEDLLNNGPQHYQSGLFSKLQYDDLKDIHETSVIPVTQEDFSNRKTFRNINELNMNRKGDEIAAKQQFTNHETIMKNNYDKDISESMGRYYDLLKQGEAQVKKNQEFWSHLKQLK